MEYIKTNWLLILIAVFSFLAMINSMHAKGYAESAFRFAEDAHNNAMIAADYASEAADEAEDAADYAADAAIQDLSCLLICLCITRVFGLVC